MGHDVEEGVHMGHDEVEGDSVEEAYEDHNVLVVAYEDHSEVEAYVDHSEVVAYVDHDEVVDNVEVACGDHSVEVDIQEVLRGAFLHDEFLHLHSCPFPFHEEADNADHGSQTHPGSTLVLLHELPPRQPRPALRHDDHLHRE